MTNKFKRLSLLSTSVLSLGLVSTLGIVSCGKKVDETVGQLVYVTNLDGTITVTGLAKYNDKIKTIYVPTEINGKKVSSIQKGAFKNCPNLNKITLPFIGASYDASGDEALFGYVFGEDTYEGCGSTTWQEYDVTNGNETTTKWCSYCIPMSLENVEITNATTIPAGAFSHCIYLEDIKINNFTGTTIYNKAFTGCIALNDFDFSCVKGLTTIENYAFNGCETFQYITLPDSVTTVGDYAFNDCDSTAAIQFSKNVTNVGECACSGIYGAILVGADEDTTKSWGGQSKEWKDSTAVVVYNFGSESSKILTTDWYGLVCGSGNNKYAYLAQWMGGWGQTEVVVPKEITYNGVTYPVEIIGGRCFQENTFVRHIVIEDGVKHIYPSTFQDCTNLEYVDIPPSIETIRANAFEGCTKLVGHYENHTPVNKIVLKDVLEIGNYAFRGCTSLLEIDSGRPVGSQEETGKTKSIGKEAFAYCTHLCPDTTTDEENCLYIPSTVESIGEGAFKYCFKYAPNAYTSSTYYPTVKFGNNNKITVIPKNCFERCGVRNTKPTTGWDAGTQYPKTLRINFNLNDAQLTTIDDYAFSDCWIASLKGARHTHIKYIGNYAFYYAQMTSDTSPTSQSKADLQMDQEIEYIGVSAFEGCSTIKSLTFNTAIDNIDGSSTEMYYNSLKYLGNRAFYNCNNQDFTDLDLSPCVNLTNTISEETKDINPSTFPDLTPRYAFAYCSYLRNVYLPGQYHYAQSLGTKTKEQIMQEHPCTSFTRIPERFFEGCTNIGRNTGFVLEIPKQVTQIGVAAFNSCTYLGKCYIDGPISYLGSSSFSGCGNVTSITKTDGTAVEFTKDLVVGSSVFNNCYKLENYPLPIYYQDGSSTEKPLTSKQWSLGEQQFYQNKNLGLGWESSKYFVIPYNCTSIGTRCFMNCENLPRIKFLRRSGFTEQGGTIDRVADLQTINAYAFSGCSSLTELNLENTNLRYMYGNAFQGCSKLASIKLPTTGDYSVSLNNKPFEGWALANGNKPIVYFGIYKHTKTTDNKDWTTDTWPFDDQSKWPEQFIWKGNGTGSSKLTFTRASTQGNYYYTCNDNLCGGDGIHFIPYAQ